MIADFSVIIFLIITDINITYLELMGSKEDGFIPKSRFNAVFKNMLTDVDVYSAQRIIQQQNVLHINDGLRLDKNTIAYNNKKRSNSAHGS